MRHRSGNDLPQAEQFYFATTKIGIGRVIVAATTFSRRAILLAGTMALQRFPISGPELRIDAAKRSNLGQSVHRFLISSPNLRIDAAKRPKQGQTVHRFLISGPDLRIDAAIRSKRRQSVHRFMILSPDLRIDAAKSSKQGQSVHRFLISSPDLAIAASAEVKTGAIPPAQGTEALCRGRGMPDGQGLRTA